MLHYCSLDHIIQKIYIVKSSLVVIKQIYSENRIVKDIRSLHFKMTSYKVNIEFVYVSSQVYKLQ